MLKHRLIPVLFLKDGFLVRSESFTVHQNIGNPVAQVERYNSWNVDELIYIDISEVNVYSAKRCDMGNAQDLPANVSELVSIVARRCFMPLSFGGGIRTLEEIRARLSLGADKVTLNTLAVEDPEFITAAAHRFGSQAIIVSIDVKRHDDDSLEVYSDRGTRATGLSPDVWAQEAERRGAGEILLNSITRDGKAAGYDLDLVRRVVTATGIPVIACGGAGSYSDFAEAVTRGGASAAAAGNIFHFKELAYPLAKKHLKSAGLNFR
ncbi:MAG: imidazole glycerol phosphate synthase cyclase subunit [Proteobacteria bacterium]|nr:imidazole glycerol phosphate synthase cyclase subunit [Pseudomonadota bacterium]